MDASDQNWLDVCRARRRRPSVASRRAATVGARSARRSGRSLRRQAARDRDDRHRQRARRSDVDGAVPRLLEPARRRGADRDDVDVDEEQGAARRHPHADRRLRAGAAEPAAAPARVSVGAVVARGRRLWPAGLRHGGGGTRQDERRAQSSSFAPPRTPIRVRSGCSRGAGRTRSRRRCCRRGRRRRRPNSTRSSSKLRVYTISDQDDAGPWIRREFPALHYIAMPSTPDGDQYAYATWTGISGDRFYKNAPGADFTTFTDAWVNANIRSKGPLGKLYPVPCCIHEGDTPSFLGLIDNGLASFMSPTYGGWGGRYVWRTFYGETHPFWTQGGDSFPGRDNSKDTVTGVDGKTYTSDQATIWRWRTAFQNDFAARMDWTIKDPAQANHNPEVVVNGQRARRRARRGDGRHAGDARRRRHPRSRRSRAEVSLVLLSGGRHRHSRSAGRPLAASRRSAEAARRAKAASRRRRQGGPREPAPRVTIQNATSRQRDGHAARRRHCAHHPGGRRQRHAAPDLVPARDPDDQAQVASRRLTIWG